MAQQPKPSKLAFRIAFVFITTILAGTILVLPFAIASVVKHLGALPESENYAFHLGNASKPAAPHSKAHIAVTDLDEAHLRMSLRVSAHRVCGASCPHTTRLVLFSVGTDETLSAGMPPSATVDLVTTEQLITREVDLPVRGHPSLYPFDVYELRLGVGQADVDADRTVHPLSRADADGTLEITVQEQLHREEMDPPTTADPDRRAQVDEPYQLQGLEVLRFSRPLYEQVLAVLLVVLIAAAAAYAVFMRPIHDLVLGSGALVLGVWGVRNILSPGTASPTLVELSLSLVILFLLGGITYRAMQHCYRQGDLHFFPHIRGGHDEPVPSSESTPSKEAGGTASPAG